jgi:hypothetical protein
MVGKHLGGVIVFGGGLALYSPTGIVGGLGASGDAGKSGPDRDGCSGGKAVALTVTVTSTPRCWPGPPVVEAFLDLRPRAGRDPGARRGPAR